MGILYDDDVVVIRQSEKEGDPTVITVNCPDKTGLGCDLCRIILFFGLSIVRGGKDHREKISILRVCLSSSFLQLNIFLFCCSLSIPDAKLSFFYSFFLSHF